MLLYVEQPRNKKKAHGGGGEDRLAASKGHLMKASLKAKRKPYSSAATLLQNW